MNLVTRATVKAFLEITTATTTYDSLIDSLITQYSKRAERFCNRLFEKTARTQKFNAGRKTIFLPAYPIDESSNLSVTIDDTVQTIDEDYYVYYDEGFIEFDTTPSYTTPLQITVTWTGGYDSESIPDDLQYAVMKQVAFVFRRRKDVGVSSVSLPDGSLAVNSPDDLLPEVRHILRNYRKTPGMR